MSEPGVEYAAMGGLEMGDRPRGTDVFPHRWIRRALPLDSRVDDPQAELRRWVVANIDADKRAGIRPRVRPGGGLTGVEARRRLLEIQAKRWPD